MHEKWYKKKVLCTITTDLKRRSKIKKKKEIKETRQKTDTKAFLQHIPTSKGANI